MFITLTNANPLYKGKPIAIKKDLIVTVHSAMVERENDLFENVTFIFVPPHGTWEVNETYEDVIDMLK